MAIVGGGFKAIRSVARYAIQIGPLNLYKAVTSKNACKACAFGTGGQNGGIHNEKNRGIEICNKNIQAHLSDIRPTIPNTFFFENDLNHLAKLSAHQLEKLGRIGTPLYKKAGEQHYSPLDTHTALELLAKKLSDTTPDRSFFYASGRSSNEAAFLLQLLARVYGTNNVNNCSYYCHQASGVGLNNTIGTGTATIRYDDLQQADLIFVFGANPASNHPRFLKCLIECRRRGGKVIVVNPAKEPGMVRFASPSDWRSMLKGGEDIASEYLQVHAGGDVACMQGIAKALLSNNQIDSSFIDEHTAGFETYAKGIHALSWASIEASSGLSMAAIENVAKQYAQSSHVVFTWSMGLTHHLHGVANIESLVALALLRGMIGKPGAGLLPLRGHSNIQGTGSMGFTPELKAAIKEKLNAKLEGQLPEEKGLDTMACMQAAAAGDMDVAVCLGGNLYAANPNSELAQKALNAIPFKCFFNTTLNLSHVHGVDQEVLIIPSRARDEEAQATTQESMFNFVRLSDGGIERHPQLWSEVDLICELGKKLIPKTRLDFALFESHDRIRAWIADTVPGFTHLKTLSNTKEEFHIDGRTFYEPSFATPSGRAQFHFHPLPIKPSDFEFTLSSVRSEGQFNSIIYHEYDTYRGQTERWVVLMHPHDMRRKDLKENALIDIVSDSGTMKAVKVKPFDVKQGNILVYYPEANILVPNAVDHSSQTPSFKSVPVNIAPARQQTTS